MKLDLRVLDHLGIKLYSNAAAVLSEAVANSWDAEAEQVTITINDNTIVIEDDGIGMTLDQINQRFLWVGYNKRVVEGDASGSKLRPFMGRKGIGKLALFSIADIVEVYTRSGNERHAFKMKVDDIRLAMEQEQEYRPEPVQFRDREKGTQIVLQGLKKQRTTRSIAALRKRIARRFSMITLPQEGDQFAVTINDKPIGPDDREDLKAIEFLWEFGDSPSINDSDYPTLRKRFLLPNQVDERHPQWLVRGWIGAASQPKKLRSDEAGALNGIVVMARGRLIQENILDRLQFSRILGSYITGQVEADFLDSAEEEDIATSDRQRLIEDDERYIALARFLRGVLVSISDEWTNLRNELRGKDALIEIPALEEWLATLPLGQQKIAERLLGLIRGVEIEDEQDRKSLYRAGIVAFERLRLREESHRLVEQGELTATHLLPLLADLSMLEGVLYREIVTSRLDVIRRFELLVDANEKERVLQQHLFDNLWLLDPGWERAAGSERLEQRLKREFLEFSSDLSDDESKGRVDIRYRTNAGEHIIVELKRANRKMHLHELVEQGSKYWSALRKCLKGVGNEEPHISIVFVVGQSLHDESFADSKRIGDTLRASFNGRVVHYETLIQGARNAYAEYLQKAGESDRLDKILRGLGT